MKHFNRMVNEKCFISYIEKYYVGWPADDVPVPLNDKRLTTV